MTKYISTKSYLLIALLLIGIGQAIQAQQIGSFTINDLELEGPGLLSESVKTDQHQKTTSIYTVGGFVTINFTKQFMAAIGGKYCRAYFDQDGKNPNISFRDQSRVAIQPQGNQIYFTVNSTLFIDILSIENDTLVKRYLIKRKYLVPTLKLDFIDENAKKSVLKASFSTDFNEVEVAPGLSLQLSNDSKNGFKDSAITYKILNLKTKRTTQYASLSEVKRIKLDANTEYELTFSYDLQKESTGTGRIKVKPYWYQSTTTYFILATVFVLILVVLILITLRKKVSSSQKEQQKMEQAALRLQSTLNPHFTFNALSTIQGLMNTDRIDEANLYLQEFSSLLRQTLNKSQHVFNSLDQELEMMRVYIKLEALRFNFSWNIQISPAIQTTEIEIPTLLLQPLIENSIKHGLSGLGNRGELLIICKNGEEKDTFVVIIKDNGTWIEKNSTAGYGLSLTRERIKTINKMKSDQKITLEFNSNAGTEAIITFHNWINT